MHNFLFPFIVRSKPVQFILILMYNTYRYIIQLSAFYKAWREWGILTKKLIVIKHQSKCMKYWSREADPIISSIIKLLAHSTCRIVLYTRIKFYKLTLSWRTSPESSTSTAWPSLSSDILVYLAAVITSKLTISDFLSCWLPSDINSVSLW